MAFHKNDQIHLFSELQTSELFFCRETREAERGQRRLVPVTVILHCDWWKPVAMLMSVFESFLLPLLCVLIG